MNKRIIIIITLIIVGGIARVSKMEDVLCGQFPCPPATSQPTDWDILVSALIQVESSGDTLAVGKTNDVGALQLTPIYVADVNRILGEERYTLEDRRSLKKTLEMFEVYQGHYNPEHDVDLAIHLHNPKAGDWYKGRVYDQMNEIRKTI